MASAGGDRSAGEIERGFKGEFPQTGRCVARVDRALDMNDRAHMRLPLRVLYGGRRVKHRDRARFVAVARFRVHGLDARQRLGGGAQGLGFLT